MEDIWKEAAVGEKAAMIILFLWVVIAVLSPWLANSEGWALIGYSYNDLLGSEGSLLPPLSSTDGNMHWLGTDTLGRDVAAGMINGARVSLVVSFLVISVGVSIGLLIGIIMGYYQDTGVRLNVLQYLWLIFCIVIFTYYKTDILFNGWSWWSASMTLTFTFLFFFFMVLLHRLPIRKYALPIDMIWQRIFELKESIPVLFLLLAISAIVKKPSLWTMSMSLIILVWVNFARHARAQMLSIKQEDYMIAAEASGMTTWRLLLQHALPNIIGPILVVISFTLSSVILIEAMLSFLGIGLPLESVTWGKILSEARKSSSAWWLALFPGLAIFALVFAFNTIADMMRDRV